jgi:hypothetical protein
VGSTGAGADAPSEGPRVLGLTRAQWVLVALVLAAGVVRFATLGLQSYWSDEAITVDLVRDLSATC